MWSYSEHLTAIYQQHIFSVGGMIQFWRVSEVCEWLKSIGLGEYREIFTLFDIGGDRLLHLDKEQLKVRFNVIFTFKCIHYILTGSNRFA